jgi:hypothetical protein
MLGYLPRPGAHAGAPHVITHNQITSQLAPTTQPNLRAPPKAMRNKLTFASRTPRMLRRQPRPTCPTCRRAACHRPRSTFGQDITKRSGPRPCMRLLQWRQQAALHVPPAVHAASTCPVHLPTPVPHERWPPPLASCSQTRPAGHAPLRTGAPVHAPLRTGAPVHAPLRTGAPVHAPLRTGAPVHAPLRTGAPVHAPLRTGAPVCMHRYAPEPELAGRGQSELGMPSVVCPVACEMRSALSPPRGHG